MQRINSSTYLPSEKYKSNSALPASNFQKSSPSCQVLVQQKESDYVTSYSSSQRYLNDNRMKASENHSFTTKKDVNVESLVGMCQTQKFRELDAQMPLDRGIHMDGDVEKYRSLLQDSDSSCDTTASSCHTFKEAQKRCRELKYKLLKKHEQLRQLQAEFRSLCQTTQKSQQEHFQLETLLRKTIASQEMKIGQLTTENQNVNKEYILEKEKVKLVYKKFHQLYKNPHHWEGDSNQKKLLPTSGFTTTPRSYDDMASHISSNSEKTQKENTNSFYLCDTLPTKVFSHHFLQTLQQLPSDLAAQIVSRVSNVLENLLIDEPIVPKIICTSKTNNFSQYSPISKNGLSLNEKVSDYAPALKTTHHDPLFFPYHTNLLMNEQKQSQKKIQRESHSNYAYPPRSSSLQPSHQGSHPHEKKEPSYHLSTSDLKHYLMQMKKMTKAPSKQLKPSSYRLTLANNDSSSHAQSSSLSKGLLDLRDSSHSKACNLEKVASSIRLSQSAMDPVYASSHSLSTHLLERSNSLCAPNEACLSYQKGNYYLEN